MGMFDLGESDSSLVWLASPHSQNVIPYSTLSLALLQPWRVILIIKVHV